jgi:GntR family transcriptional regulator, transcriptional repressor for pyruvate dehydrogenase complex
MEKRADQPDFEPIITVTRAELVEERIRAYLKKKKLKPGDPIPKETELAESLGVSRNVIREALSRFRMLGLIESRKKRGMILTKPDIMNGFERVLDPNLLDPATLVDIFEMRLVLEMGMAELIFLKKTSKDIAELEKIVSKSPGQNDVYFKLEHEVEFHSKLYEITGNETLHRFQRLLLPIFQFVIEEEAHQKQPPKTGKVDHRQLVEIIKTGTPMEFRQSMYSHLEPHFEWIALKKKDKK